MSMTITDSRMPDALYMPESLKRGARQIDRINSVMDLAEPLLGVDRSRGERAYAHRQDGGWLFITKDPEDTILYPNGSPLAGQVRYVWVMGEDGIKRGYLQS